MNPVLTNQISIIKGQLEKIPESRKDLLTSLAQRISQHLSDDKRLGLVFVCTQNSRRSFFSETWAQLAIEHYKLGKKLQAFSAGSEATAIHPNTLNTLQSQGFDLEIGAGTNPIIKVFTDRQSPLLLSFSKSLENQTLPKENFVAIMVCSDADKNCPFVPGAILRQPVTFDDPKVSDGTSSQKETYETRSLEIASHMFYLLSEIDKISN